MRYWNLDGKYRGAIRKQFQRWAVPRNICDDLDLSDGIDCHVIVRLDDYSYAGIVTLTSGEEFNLPAVTANELRLRAVRNPSASIVFSLSVTPLLESIQGNFSDQVREAMALPPATRQMQLSKIPETPQRVEVTTTTFRRNAMVAAEVRYRANGICEECKCKAPFIGMDGKPYLEVHHRQRLADGGVDTVENAIALCPNCHRKAHYGATV